jgi:hypothetical protein
MSIPSSFELSLEKFLEKNPNPTISDVFYWVYLTSDRKYIMVERAILEEALYTFAHNVIVADEVNSNFKRKWRDTIKMFDLGADHA